jgi:hypothetical protein
MEDKKKKRYSKDKHIKIIKSPSKDVVMEIDSQVSPAPKVDKVNSKKKKTKEEPVSQKASVKENKYRETVQEILKKSEKYSPDKVKGKDDIKEENKDKPSTTIDEKAPKPVTESKKEVKDEKSDSKSKHSKHKKHKSKKKDKKHKSDKKHKDKSHQSDKSKSKKKDKKKKHKSSKDKDNGRFCYSHILDKVKKNEESKDVIKELPKESHEMSESKTSMPAPPIPTTGLKKVITKGDFRKKKDKSDQVKKPKKSKEEKDNERDIRQKEKNEEREKKRELKQKEKEEERSKKKLLKVRNRH